jgi:transcriptional regulator with XRE-family HTH domain
VGPSSAHSNGTSPGVKGRLPVSPVITRLWDNSYGMDELTDAASPIAREVFRRMRGAGLTQKALAVKAGVNEGYVRDLFRGKSLNPRQDHLAKIAMVLGCTIMELIDPGASHRAPQRGEVVNKPDELALLQFWRTLTLEGKRHVIRTAIDAVPGLEPGLTNGNHG